MTVKERKAQILARLREVGVRVADVSVGHEHQPETWQVHLKHLHSTPHEQKAIAIVLRDIAHPPKPRVVRVPPIDTVQETATLPVSTPPVDVPSVPKRPTTRKPKARPVSKKGARTKRR